jgi:hypothetical protein
MYSIGRRKTPQRLEDPALEGERPQRLVEEPVAERVEHRVGRAGSGAGRATGSSPAGPTHSLNWNAPHVCLPHVGVGRSTGPRPGEEPDPGVDRTQRQGRGNPAVRATDGWTDDGENVVHLRPAAQMCSMACASSSSWSLSTRCREPLRIDSRAARPIRAKTMTKNAGASSLPVRSMSHTAR